MRLLILLQSLPAADLSSSTERRSDQRGVEVDRSILVGISKTSKTRGEFNSSIILDESHTRLSVSEDKNSNSSSSTHLFGNFPKVNSDGNDLDFDYDDGEDTLKVGVENYDLKEQEMQKVLLKAMKKPAIRKQIGEVIPILRVMSPAQRLTLAALVSSQITSQSAFDEENLIKITAMFANKNAENTDDRHNITEHLLLPISMDIAKMFKGLGKEMGRNLRQNFDRPLDRSPSTRNKQKNTTKSFLKNEASIKRRMDEEDYAYSEEQSPTNKPVADALKQPGVDECDYFTKSLCLEVSNYPTEAIILSLKENQNIASTFLTDFEPKEGGNDSKNRNSGRRFERRRDGKKEVQEPTSDEGYMCPSSVKYARPKRARTTSGQWKYIVNAGEYTQTLRLEICLKPRSPCSYVTNHLNSECTQIYNYHRLLTWDEGRGLHMDIFKVPSCCSCHIQGYSTYFPPNKDFTFAEKRKEPPEGLGTDSVLELPNRPPYGYVGNKREIPKPTSNVSVKNQSRYLINTKDFFRNPADHLVPPGPPLPLEDESIFNTYAEPALKQKNVLPELNRRYPVQAEYRRPINKVTDTQKEVSTNTRLKASSPSISERPIIKHNKPHYAEVHPKTYDEKNPIFDANTKISFQEPSFSTLAPFISLESKKEKSNDGSVFVTVKPYKDLVYQKQATQYFKADYFDTKSLPSRISLSYVTSPEVKQIESRMSTSSVPPVLKPEITFSEQKKINYNYHPIIDFFFTDSKKRQSSYSGPPSFNSQDWTPVFRH